MVECNCSTCRRHGFLHWKVPAKAVSLKTEQVPLSTYGWQDLAGAHHFRPTCGTPILRTGFQRGRFRSTHAASKKSTCLRSRVGATMDARTCPWGFTVGDRADAPQLAQVVTSAWQVGFRGLLSQPFLDGLDPGPRPSADPSVCRRGLLPLGCHHRASRVKERSGAVVHCLGISMAMSSHNSLLES
jgi:hypothetical protein